ncbi:hypothetical protein [Candidatus Albibeggiatoa sp. nov. NOAA]|uniref:hypothetical protein n=1 Tax=Candidatus Albibeggiatoa sp. nov. NOAA TaxID=3162724 RepID=UPI0032F59486|nr:hypothetical protein [Thiotrichaceae bacterium]
MGRRPSSSLVIQHLERPVKLGWPYEFSEDQAEWMTAWEKGLKISHDCPFEPNVDLIRNLNRWRMDGCRLRSKVSG